MVVGTCSLSFACGGGLGPTAPGTNAAQPSVSASASRPRGPAIVAAALDVDVYGPDGGQPIAHVAHGDVLSRTDALTRIAVATPRGSEIIEGPRVRIRTDGGEIVEGWVDLPKKEARHGVGFFATKAVPVVTNRGMVLGALAPGAFVPLVRIEVDVARVMLVPFGVEGVVPLSSLATREPAKVDAARDVGPMVDNRLLQLETADGPTTTACGHPIQVDAAEGDGVHVRQTVDGVTVNGITRHDAMHCPVRVAWSGDVPPGFVRPSTATTTFFAKSRDVYRIMNVTPPACVRWRFRTGPKPTFVATMTSRAFGRTDTVTLTYRAENAAARVTLPAWLNLRETDDESAVDVDLVVDESPVGLLVLDRSLTPEPSEHGSTPLPIAYHRADASIWFASEADCLRALERSKGDLRARLLAGYAE